jgi:hypothetical protein
MPELSPKARQSLARSRWAVIQTGLITTGLALFGVYVLANRINEEHVMTLYVLRWIPAGPWIVGTIAGSGYAIASWWLGAPVRGMLYAAVLALQACAYLVGHYTDLQSMELVYRDTREPVAFRDYFHYATINLGHNVTAEPIDDAKATRIGYSLRTLELIVFCMGAAGSGVMLIGASRCHWCHGSVKQVKLGTLTASRLPAALPSIEHFTNTAQAEPFMQLIRQPHESGVAAEVFEVNLCRCRACGNATIELTPQKSAQRDGAQMHVFAVSYEFAEAVVQMSTPVLVMT